MTKCINEECSRKGSCTRFRANGADEVPALYPDGGVECTKYIDKYEIDKK